MAETWEMVGVPVLGKLLGCRTVFVAGERRVDKMELLQGRVAAVAVAGRAVVVVNGPLIWNPKVTAIWTPRLIFSRSRLPVC